MLESGVWKGVMTGGKIGLFRAFDVAPLSPASLNNGRPHRKGPSPSVVVLLPLDEQSVTPHSRYISVFMYMLVSYN